MLDLDSPARVGSSSLFVAEADESDGSFLKYQPHISVLSNIEADHLDYHGDLSGLASCFQSYLNNTQEDGCSIVCWDDPLCREVSDQANVNRLTYGINLGCDVRAIDIHSYEGKTEFTAIVERDQVRCKVNLIGKHNVLNCLAVLATARALHLDVSLAAKSLASYKGVARRLNLIADLPDLLIYDDYAHNPGKIMACLKALKENLDSHRLYVVFQQHRFSRLKTTFEKTSESFSYADHVFVLPVYAAGEVADDKYTPEYLSKSISIASKVNCTPVSSTKDTAEQIIKKIEKPAIIITIGAGNVWTVGNKLKEMLIASKASNKEIDHKEKEPDT